MFWLSSELICDTISLILRSYELETALIRPVGKSSLILTSVLNFASGVKYQDLACKMLTCHVIMTPKAQDYCKCIKTTTIKFLVFLMLTLVRFPCHYFTMVIMLLLTLKTLYNIFCYLCYFLNHVWPIQLQCRSIDWFLYECNIGQMRVKNNNINNNRRCCNFFIVSSAILDTCLS